MDLLGAMETERLPVERKKPLQFSLHCYYSFFSFNTQYPNSPNRGAWINSILIHSNPTANWKKPSHLASYHHQPTNPPITTLKNSIHHSFPSTTMQITKNQTHPRKSGHSHHQYLQHHNKLPYEAHKEWGKKRRRRRERENTSPENQWKGKRERERERERENRNQPPKPNGKRKEKRGEKKNRETKPRPSVKKKKVMMSGLGRTQKIKEQSKKKSQVCWERREPLESQVGSHGFDNTQNMGPISWVKLRKCHYNSNFITLFFFFLFFTNS